MRRESIYISLPITGHREQEQREKAQSIKNRLLEMGYSVVINPFDIGDALKGRLQREPTYEEYMKADIWHLLTCTAIYMCEGWSGSAGCLRERREAIGNYLDVVYEYSY